MPQMTVTSAGKEHVPGAVKLLSKVFEDDPVIVYMLYSLSDEQRIKYMTSWFRSLVVAAALNNAVIEEANDWSSCTIWLPPGCKVDNPWTYIQAGFLKILWSIGLKGCKRMLVDFQSQSNAAKNKGLGSRKDFYYLFFTGTALDQRKKGLSSGLIRRYQDIAAERKLPIWLEATTSDSMRLYTKLGFRTVQEIVLGAGTAGSDGKPRAGGEGVKVWAMIWEPQEEKHS